MTSNIYARLPSFAQHAAVSAYGLRERWRRYGGTFSDVLALLQETEWYEREGIEASKLAAIRRLVGHAIQHVPYYRETYGALDVHPSDLRSLADFRALPVIDKHVVRSRPDDFQSELSANRADLVAVHTSGTTGTPLRFYTTQDAVRWQWAVWWRYRARLGLWLDDWHVSFTGKLTDSHTRGVPWRTDLARRQVVVGLRSVSTDRLTDLVARCTEPNVRYWTGYPSIISDFASRVIATGGHQVAHVPVVTTGAEPMTAQQRDLIDQAFDVGVFSDQYGLSEAAANFSQCGRGHYHEDWEFTHVDLEKRERTEGDAIVGTNLINDAFPLIRYDTGDSAVAAGECACGRESATVDEIVGRDEDALLTPEGARVTRFDYIFKGVDGLIEAQVRQREEGAIDIMAVPTSGRSTNRLEEAVRANVRTYISGELEVRFHYVPRVPRSTNGKFRPVVSEL